MFLLIIDTKIIYHKNNIMKNDQNKVKLQKERGAAIGIFTGCCWMHAY